MVSNWDIQIEPKMLTYFRYLGRVISAVDNDWTVMIIILEKARSVWSMMTMILSRKGEEPQVSGFLSKAAVQSVLIFDADTWVGPGGGSRTRWYDG